MSANLATHKGGCHCGNVRFEVDAPRDLLVIKCSCSICTKKQNLHFIVPAARFRLLKQRHSCSGGIHAFNLGTRDGESELTTYTFGTHLAKHTFCKTCGVQSFYYPRSNPDGVGVMPHCLDQSTVASVVTKEFNGADWEQSMLADTHISHMSKE